MGKLFLSTRWLLVMLECLRELEKERMTMVKTFTSPHCYSNGITVHSKGSLGNPWSTNALKES
jgi:ABC-type transport system involved in cytochrome c biogenesis ATPase subunit